MAQRKLISAINVTPFVDVMLVLLIIFMVTAPMMQEGIDVNLPKVDTEGMESPNEPIVISIDKYGNTFISDTEYSSEEFERKLKAIAKAKGTGTGEMVLLKADADVAYHFVAKAMASIRSAGIEKVGMVTEPNTKRK